MLFVGRTVIFTKSLHYQNEKKKGWKKDEKYEGI